MTINVSPDPRLQFFGNDGKPLVGGKLYTYAAGTTTLLATYTDWYGTTPNTNPIILDSRGEASVWLGTARYKFVLKDANDVEVYTQDNLIMSPGADGAGAYGTWPIDISGNAATATTATSVTGGFVKSIIAGSGITVDHATGDVTVSVSGGGGAVTSITSAVPGFSFSGTDALTFNGPLPATLGNVLTSDGSNWISSAGAYPLTSATAVASTSGTSIDFTSIPSWVKRITVNLNGVSTNGTSVIQIQLGSGGVPDTTGYSAMVGMVSTSSNVTRGLIATTGFILQNVGNASNANSGSVVFSLISSNIWACQGTVFDGLAYVQMISGVKSLSGILTRVRITTINGTDTFDAGSINILYE